MNMRELNRLLFDRYAEILKFANFNGPDKTDSKHLLWMCENVDCKTWPIDKISRWLGFVQGVMIVNNLITVDGERDYTRPLFREVYEKENYLADED